MMNDDELKHIAKSMMKDLVELADTYADRFNLLWYTMVEIYANEHALSDKDAAHAIIANTAHVYNKRAVH
jgi:hypothetical protein